MEWIQENDRDMSKDTEEPEWGFPWFKSGTIWASNTIKKNNAHFQVQKIHVSILGYKMNKKKEKEKISM